MKTKITGALVNYPEGLVSCVLISLEHTKQWFFWAVAEAWPFK